MLCIPVSLCSSECVDDNVVDLITPKENVLPVERVVPLMGLAEPGGGRRRGSALMEGRREGGY